MSTAVESAIRLLSHPALLLHVSGDFPQKQFQIYHTSSYFSSTGSKPWKVPLQLHFVTGRSPPVCRINVPLAWRCSCVAAEGSLPSQSSLPLPTATCSVRLRLVGVGTLLWSPSSFSSFFLHNKIKTRFKYLTCSFNPFLCAIRFQRAIIITDVPTLELLISQRALLFLWLEIKPDFHFLWGCLAFLPFFRYAKNNIPKVLLKKVRFFWGGWGILFPVLFQQ